jgi:iron complex outermembrane recepter protein
MFKHCRRLGIARHIRGTAVLFVLAIGTLMFSAANARAQSAQVPDRTAALKRMSLDELWDLEVTTISKRPEKLTETASAVQVITGEDIRRSGATNVPEALRLASNLRVAQVNAHAWVISTRGFSGIFTNKLLVLIDGRVVYTPLFAGVLWDVQNLVLEDIERIEVVSGPGGTLWGTNAVNGVINIITKSAGDTQGLYAAGSVGSSLGDLGAVRYGGRVGSNLSFRVSGQRSDRDATWLNGTKSPSAWNITQGGFRMDWNPSAGANHVTVQGDVYQGTEETVPRTSKVDGQNVLGRWTHTFSKESDVTVQVYFDRTWRRDVPSTFTDELLTSDVDVQHRFRLGGRNNVVWGAGYRLMQDDTPTSTAFVGLLPQSRDMHLFSGFAQDDIAILPSRLKVTFGAKVERNSFSGVEVQPSGRLAWTPNDHQTIWAAISRAVRSPSRLDVDYHIPAFPIAIGTPGVNGGPEFRSETLVAYELGYRAQVTPKSSVSLATFYNKYDDLYSVESVGGTRTYQIENGTRGWSSGFELADTYQPASWWRLRGGYTYFHKKLSDKPGHHFDSSSLGNDPSHQVLLQSILDLPAHTQFDGVIRYTSRLPAPPLPGQSSLNLRFAWQVRHWELSIVGQNLTDDRHSEFGLEEISRSVYGKVTTRF